MLKLSLTPSLTYPFTHIPLHSLTHACVSCASPLLLCVTRVFVACRHTNIVKYKTAFYSFYLPVAAAMHMAGIKDEQAFSNAQVRHLPRPFLACVRLHNLLTVRMQHGHTHTDTHTYTHGHTRVHTRYTHTRTHTHTHTHTHTFSPWLSPLPFSGDFA